MGTEVEHASGNVQTGAMTPSSVASSGPKTSMFAKKSGFVIPKNKLSGSLVPVFRGTKKGDTDLGNDDTGNQVQRKTKWGPDLTLDTTVRKGRASAYQIRIDQISQQLTLGALELEDNVESQAAPDHQLSKEELEVLELEKREVIGELLKLNPTYKAPADYKPLLREAKVPIPTKEHPGYNFIGLVFGSSSDTLKRLEKETGAKIRVYGTKADTGAKVEFTPTDGKEGENTYENLYVHVTADTFEKVDAAVALIELLVTPVSVNPGSSTMPTVSADAANTTGLSQSMPGSIITPPVINQGMTQPFTGSLPPPQGQFPQFPQPWFPGGPTQPPAYPQAGLHAPSSSAVSIASSTVQASSMPFNPPNMPPLFGSRPMVAPNFTPYSQQALPLGPRNTNPLPGPPHNIRLPISAPPQPAPTEPVRWLPPPVGGSAPQGPVVPGLRPVTYLNNMITPPSGASQPAGPVASQQPHGGFSSGLQPSPIGPQHAMPQLTMRAPSPNAVPGPAPRPFPMQPGNAPRPQQPSSGDFTFQPHRPPPQIWPSNQPPHHNVRPPQVQAGHGPMAPQPPFRPLPHNPPVQGFPRPQMSNQVNQSRPQIPPNFAGTPPGPMVPPRHPTLPGPNPMQPRNFVTPHPINNSPVFPPIPGNQMHIQENRPQRFPVPHQYFGNHPGKPQQVYDPFSPTAAAPFNPQTSSNASRAHGENDPEYEDLMASVGVK